MIFSNKLTKISSGKNLTLFANSAYNLDLYIFNKNIKKKKLDFSSIIKCTNTDENFSYNFYCKLNDNYFCVGHDDNMSIINYE